MTPGARATIRLDALEHNLSRIRDAAGGAHVFAVVKANAYGHGLATIAGRLAGADGLAVARFDEAVVLSGAVPDKPILVLEGFHDSEELEGTLARNLQPVVHCEHQLRLLERHPAGDAVVWMKIDTGMHRLGFDYRRIAEVSARLRSCASVGEVRLMTHLACADDKADSMTRRQLDIFSSLLEGFDGSISIANSPGLFGWPESVAGRIDPGRCWVRAGLCLYGVSPFPDSCGSDLGLQPVMEFSACLIDVKPIPAGETVGYGATWRAPRDTMLGIVAAGYGDGYSRFLPSGTPVLVNGRRTSLAGRVSMDMAVVDLGPKATDAVGDPVTLWGRDLPVEEVAAHAGTIPYQLLCGVTERTRRLPLG